MTLKVCIMNRAAAVSWKKIVIRFVIFINPFSWLEAVVSLSFMTIWWRVFGLRETVIFPQFYFAFYGPNNELIVKIIMSCSPNYERPKELFSSQSCCLRVWIYNIVTIANVPQLIKESANKKSVMRRLRSDAGCRSVMRCVMCFLFSWLWLKSSVRYEMKSLPWFICVRVVFSVSACVFYNSAHCNPLRNKEWSQPSKWPIDNPGQLRGCPVI